MGQSFQPVRDGRAQEIEDQANGWALACDVILQVAVQALIPQVEGRRETLRWLVGGLPSGAALGLRLSSDQAGSEELTLEVSR